MTIEIPVVNVAPAMLNEPWPCEDCEHIETCKNENVSCFSYHLYVNYKGLVDKRNREPSVGWYYRTFHKHRKPRSKSPK